MAVCKGKATVKESLYKGYVLRRTRRKTLALEVNREGRVIIRAPINLPLDRIDGFLKLHNGWLEDKTKEAQARVEAKERLGSNLRERLLREPISLLGHSYYTDPSPKGYGRSAVGFTVPLDYSDDESEEFKRRFKGLLMDLAKEVLPKRFQELSLLTGYSASSLKITDAKTRWGSCSSKNAIALSWRLVGADLAEIDYVIIHELCHTRFHNHSKDFWNDVGRFCPEWPMRRQGLGQASRGDISIFD